MLSRADEKRYSKEKRDGSRHRAERVAIVNEMTTEEARNTEVSITKTGRGTRVDMEMYTSDAILTMA